MAETPAAAANPSVDKQPPSDTRTLDDYKQGESFYKQLCGDKDEEIRALKEEVEVKKTVIDHLRAELLAVQKAAANPNSVTAGGAANAATAGATRNANTLSPVAVAAQALVQVAKDEKPPGSAKKKRGRPKKQENATDATNKQGSPAEKNKRKRRTYDSEKQKHWRSKLEEKWNVKILELKEYKNTHGNCNVPMKYKENPSLGSWVNKQRENYRAVLRNGPEPGAPPKISNERIAQLEALDFCWNVKETKDGANAELLSDKAWNEHMKKLIAYKEEYGDCLVPTNWKPNQQLANFVGRVRRAFKLQKEYKLLTEAASDANTTEGKSSMTASSTKTSKGMPSAHWLTQPRIDRLNELGFVWSVRESPAEIWNDRYERLKAYKEKFGNCRVPIKYDKTLNFWILSQRHYYRNTMDEEKAKDKKLPKLSAEKIVKLQRIGFEWEVLEKVKEESWEARFRDLISFKAEHKHCRVPKQYRPNMKLSNWVYEQRKNYKGLKPGAKRGRRGLTDERIRRLEEVGFEWSVMPSKTSKRGVEVSQGMGNREEAAAAVAAAGDSIPHGYSEHFALVNARLQAHPRYNHYLETHANQFK